MTFSKYVMIYISVIFLIPHIIIFFSAKSYKVDVLNAAASFLNSLARAKRANCKSGNHGPSSPDSEFGASPVSTRSNLSSPSSPDSGNSSSIFEESPEKNLVASPGFHRPWKL